MTKDQKDRKEPTQDKATRQPGELSKDELDKVSGGRIMTTGDEDETNDLEIQRRK